MKHLMLALWLLQTCRLAPSRAALSSVALSTKSGYRNFRFGATQRCYSLDSCYDNAASYASWLFVKKGAQIVFYTQSACQGEDVASSDTPRGSLVFADVGLDKLVSSFMVWDGSPHATNGLLDICHDWERVELLGNATHVDEAGYAVHNSSRDARP